MKCQNCNCDINIRRHLDSLTGQKQSTRCSMRAVRMIDGVELGAVHKGSPQLLIQRADVVHAITALLDVASCAESVEVHTAIWSPVQTVQTVSPPQQPPPVGGESLAVDSARGKDGDRITTFPLELEAVEADMLRAVIQNRFDPSMARPVSAVYMERLLAKVQRVADQFVERRAEIEHLAATLTDEERAMIRQHRARVKGTSAAAMVSS